MNQIACPTCGMLNHRHQDGAGSTPKDGDYGICWSCHALAVFTSGGTAQRLPTLEEYGQATSDPDVRQAMSLLGACDTPFEAVRWLGELAQRRS